MSDAATDDRFAQPVGIPIESDACPVCGTPGGRYATHVCMTAGVPSHTPEPLPDDAVLGYCSHGVNLDRDFCPEGCRV